MKKDDTPRAKEILATTGYQVYQKGGKCRYDTATRTHPWCQQCHPAPESNSRKWPHRDDEGATPERNEESGAGSAPPQTKVQPTVMDRARAACANNDPESVCTLLQERLADPRGYGAKTDDEGLSVEDEEALWGLVNHLESELQRASGNGQAVDAVMAALNKEQRDTLCRWIGRLPRGEIDKSKYRSLDDLHSALDGAISALETDGVSDDVQEWELHLLKKMRHVCSPEMMAVETLEQSGTRKPGRAIILLCPALGVAPLAEVAPEARLLRGSNLFV